MELRRAPRVRDARPSVNLSEVLRSGLGRRFRPRPGLRRRSGSRLLRRARLDRGPARSLRLDGAFELARRRRFAHFERVAIVRGITHCRSHHASQDRPDRTADDRSQHHSRGAAHDLLAQWNIPIWLLFCVHRLNSDDKAFGEHPRRRIPGEIHALPRANLLTRVILPLSFLARIIALLRLTQVFHRLVFIV